MPQPYFLPANMAQLGMDEGPFDVSIVGGITQTQSALVTYGRRAMGETNPAPTFALVDRSFEYDSRPTEVPFPGLLRDAGELSAAAYWPTGQVAFARYNTRSGLLEVATAICFR
jgi:hypothetical protein